MSYHLELLPERPRAFAPEYLSFLCTVGVLLHTCTAEAVSETCRDPLQFATGCIHRCPFNASLDTQLLSSFVCVVAHLAATGGTELTMNPKL